MFFFIVTINFADASLNDADIPTISIALKSLYRKLFSKTKTSPLDAKSYRKLDQIYVNLSMLHGVGRESKPDITYEHVFQILSNEETITRIAFLGEAGVGKTTLLSKIAYDWAVGKYLVDVELLFFVPLREIQQPLPLCDILQTYASRGMDFNKKKVEEYVRGNQRKVLILLDGLDEYSGDITDVNSSDILTGIMRGDKLKNTPVIVTTRPWRAYQIDSTPTIQLRYSRIVVKGFRKKDVKEYINKYFNDDKESADGLIKVMTEDSLVAEHMSPYPIFCCMLCNMWKEESRRGRVKMLETFTELFEEMISSLTEHWLSKHSFRQFRKRCNDSFKQIGKIAFEGLLSDSLVFTEETFEECMDAMKTGCEIGVLTAEHRFAHVTGSKERKQIDVSFPHKLFQEHLAGIYLASLYLADQKHFWKLVNNILPNSQKFRHLLYFTVAHGKAPGHAGKPLMEAICEQVEDEEFVADITFEYHDEAVLSMAAECFRTNCSQLRLTQRLHLLEKHTWSGYMYILAFCGRGMVRLKHFAKIFPGQKTSCYANTNKTNQPKQT